MNIKTKIILIVGVVLSMSLLGGCGSPSSSGSQSPSPSGGSNNTSTSGSTAAMLIRGDVLYALDSTSATNFPEFKVYDLTAESGPELVSSEPLNGAETLFIYGEHLYVGGQFGVDIWTLEDPLNPQQVNFYDHARGCDPIIVDNDIGYITLRSRPGCFGDVNRLEIVDFSDPEAPVELLRYPMDFPYGLAKMGDYLAVCQESFGLSILDVDVTETEEEMVTTVEEVTKFPQINCFDAIYQNEILLVTATDGIYQFSVEDYWVSPLSIIPVGGSE